MDLKSIGSAIAKLAPTVATVLAGPLAGTAVSSLESIFGFNASAASTADAEAAIAGATPEQTLALRALETNYKLALAQAGYADTANARAREEAVHDSTPRLLAYLVVAMTIAGEGFLLIHGTVVGADQAIVGRIMGTLDSALMLVLSYFFGSSHNTSNASNK